MQRYGRGLTTHALAILRCMGRKSTTLKLQLLGAFRVVIDSRTIESAAWRLRKARHIVKILALAPNHRLHREQVFDLLWPDLPPESAANNMRVTLHAARHMLDPKAPGATIGLEQEWLSLSPSAPPDVDVERFEEAAAQAQGGDGMEVLQSAVNLYGGELLPEDRYEEWAIERRVALQETYLRLLMQLGRALEERGQFSDALATYQQAVHTNRTLETAHRGLMRAYAATGRREQAVRQFHEVEAILRAEVEVEPDQETVALFHSITAGSEVARPQVDAAPAEAIRQAQVSVLDFRPSDLAEQRTSFIGLFTWWNSPASRARTSCRKLSRRPSEFANNLTDRS